MKTTFLKLLFCLISLSQTLSQQTIYIDAGGSQGNGSPTSPYSDLNTALTAIQAQGVNNYTLMLSPSASSYSIQTSYALGGSNITLQNSQSPSSSGSTFSSTNCSSFPQITINGGGITANTLLLNGIQFLTANNIGAPLSLSASQVTITNSCFQIDSITSTSSNASNTVQTPPTDIGSGYTLLVQGSGSSDADLTMSNIYISGAMMFPPLISAFNLDTAQFTSITATSFPQMNIISENTYFQGFTVNGEGQSQLQVPSNAGTVPCWSKIAYSSDMQFNNVQILNLNVTVSPAFFCIYQMGDADGSDDPTQEQNLMLNGLTFENNALGMTNTWSLMYLTLIDSDDISRNITLDTLNIAGNTVASNSTSTYLFTFSFSGDLTLSNVYFANNLNLEFMNASPGNTQLNSNLALFENSIFSGNTWNFGNIPTISISINPMIDLQFGVPIQPSTTISNISLISNTMAQNFLDLTNDNTEGEYEAFYLTPRVMLTTVTINDNIISSSTVFTIQLFNLDFYGGTITNNNLTSSNIFQSSAGCPPLQMTSITVTGTNLANSNLIYKQFDISQIVESTTTDSNNTLIPYSVLIVDFNITNSTFTDYSTAFKTQSAPLLFMQGCGFQNLTFNATSSLVSASDLLSLLTNNIFDPDAILNSGYPDYLLMINNANLTSAFQESLPMNQSNTFNLNYATGNLTNSLLFIYRIYNCDFYGLSLSNSDLMDISTVSLNQSLVSIDGNMFSGVTLVSIEDSIISSATVQSLNFGYNQVTQSQGTGSAIITSQVPFLTVVNNNIYDNQGSSLLELTSYVNYNILIANNIIDNIQAVQTYISISMSSNAGFTIFSNNSFNVCYLTTDPSVYGQLNFISIDNQMTSGVVTAPNFYFNECNFTNIIMYKNHPLIKQYQNSFLVTNLADDIFCIENSLFNNISIQYAHNLLVAISDVFQMINTTVSNIQNYDKYGSVYILALSILVDGSTFTNNNASFGSGAALYIDYDSIVNASTTVTIQNSFFLNNIAAQGTAICYTTKAIDLTVFNNTFTDNSVSVNSGSYIYFYNVTFTGLVFDQNKVYFTQPTPNYFVLFGLDTVGAAPGVSLSLTGTTVSMSSNVSGTLFSVQNSNVNLELTGLNVLNTSVSSGNTNELTILYAQSGNITLNDVNIANISSNVRSLIDILCTKDNNTNLVIQGSTFSTFALTHNAQSLVYSSDYPYTGIVHLSNRGGRLTCNNTLLINQTTFEYFNYENQNISGSDPSVVVVDYNGAFSLEIQDSYFENLGAVSGPAINLQSVSNLTSMVNISGNQFINSTSYYEGGAIYNSQNNVMLTGNTFENCISLQRSGATFYSNITLNFTSIQDSNTFINATRYYDYPFQDNQPLGTLPTILNLTFFTPSYISQSMNGNTIVLGNFSGYDLQNINISAVLTDAMNQTVYDTSSSNTGSQALSLEVLGKYSESRNCNSQQCTMIQPNLPIKGNASQTIQGQVNYESPEFTLSSSYFDIILRACINGELDADVTKAFSGIQCSPCLSGTYGLDVLTDTECLACPEFATCLGGNTILVDAGYWRANTSTALIVECTNSAACLGGFESTCETGYAGLLCDSCDTTQKWVQDKGECALCPSAEKSLLIFILVCLFTLGFQVWFIKSTRISNSYFIAYEGNTFDTEVGRRVELKITQGMYIRLLTTYSQIFAIIATFNIDFLNIFANFQAITEALANPTVALFYSSTCSLIDIGISDQRLLYYKVTFVVLSPLIKGFVLLAFRLFYWRFKITEKRLSILLITAICLFLLEQPSITTQLFNYLSCIQVEGDPNYYLQDDLGYQCYTSTYNTFRNFVVIPGLIFYVFVAPFAIAWFLIKNRRNLDSHTMRMNLGALYNEYKPTAYYWGICLMYTKIVLIYLGSTLQSDLKTKALSVFVVLYIYYAFFVQVKPYERNDLYQSERISLITYLLTAFGSIYYKDNSLGFVQGIILVVITFFNIYVIGLLAWKIFKMYLVQARDIILPILNRFRGEQSVDIDFSNDDELDDMDELNLEKVEEKIFSKSASEQKTQGTADEEVSKPKSS